MNGEWLIHVRVGMCVALGGSTYPSFPPLAGHTGKESVYTRWKEYEIMLHVAPLLPKTNDSAEQYLGRKRHLGNDIVLILYQEDPTQAFRMSTIRSRQNRTSPPPLSPYSLFRVFGGPWRDE